MHNLIWIGQGIGQWNGGSNLFANIFCKLVSIVDDLQVVQQLECSGERALWWLLDEPELAHAHIPNRTDVEQCSREVVAHHLRLLVLLHQVLVLLCWIEPVADSLLRPARSALPLVCLRLAYTNFAQMVDARLVVVPIQMFT